VSLAVALAILRNRFQQLEYLTFTRQPFTTPSDVEADGVGAR